MAFEIIFSFDEVISSGHKENVTIAQVKQYVEMESHEEKLHKLIIESKINDTKDVMKRKANEIEKNRVCIFCWGQKCLIFCFKEFCSANTFLCRILQLQSLAFPIHTS